MNTQNINKKQKSKGLIRSFVPYYKPYKWILAADLFCSLIFAVAGIMFPMLVRSMLENMSSALNVWGYIGVMAAAMIGIKLLEVGSSWFMITVGHIMGTKIEADMRKKLYTKFLQLDHSFYDNNKTGDLMSRVNNDLFEITEFAHHCPEEFFVAIVKLVGIFGYLMTIHIPLTLIMYACIPPMVVFCLLYNKKLKKRFAEQRVQVAEINSQLEDSISGMSVVKSFANEELDFEKFEKQNQEFVNIKRKSYKNLGTFYSVIKLFTGLTYIITVVFGVYYINKSNGGFTVNDLMAYVLYVSTILLTVEVIVTYTEQFQRGMSGFARYQEIMNAPVPIADEDNPKELLINDVKGNIEFRDVSFKYEKTNEYVLENVSFKIKSGEKIALVGPSGAGKTTIVNLVPRFYDVTAGSVLIDGNDIRDLKLKDLRSAIGVVQQNVYLFSGTLRENILYGKPNATEEEMLEAARLAGVDEFAESLPMGYDTDCGEKGVKLSGGQKQRISIARVFLKNPPILILDEATSALDNESEKLVQESLERLSDGRTSITIAHRLTTVRDSDRILVVTKNGIEEQGTHEELIGSGGVYAGLYKFYENLH